MQSGWFAGSVPTGSSCWTGRRRWLGGLPPTSVLPPSSATPADYPLRSRSVQSVFCTTGILEHVDADAQIGILAELLRACGPDGVVLLTVFDVEVPAASLARVAAGCAASISVVRRWPAAGIALYRLTPTRTALPVRSTQRSQRSRSDIKDNWSPLIRSKASGPMRRRWRDAS